MITLRGYQEEAVAATWKHLHDGGGSAIICMATGSGKSLVLAEFTRRVIEAYADERVVILTHVRELIEQDERALRSVWPSAPAGIYSAGLGSREIRQITFAGVQSVYKKASLFGSVGLVLIDEAHMIPAHGEGMYHEFLDGLRQANPALKVVGASATPYRLDSGNLHGPGRLFSSICYEVPISRLIKDGHLCRLRGRIGSHKVDLSQVQVRGHEFVDGDLERVMNTDANVEAAVDEIMTLCADRQRWIVFCCGVKHADTVAKSLLRRGVPTGMVTGETPAKERDAILADFKAGKLRAVTNVGVLTTGFDCPQIDAVIMLRPTMSTGLYIQQAGRGMRPSPGKVDCLLADFGGNCLRHGPVDMPSVEVQYSGKARCKECPECHAPIPTGCRVCPECQYAFPPPPKVPVRLVTHDTKASDLAVMTTMDDDPERHEVRDLGYGMINTPVYFLEYSIHQSTPFKPRTLQVTYHCARRERFKEWVCLDHPEGSFPRNKAERWWRERSDEPTPASVVDAATLSPGLKRPMRLTVDTSGKYPRIMTCLNLQIPEEEDVSEPTLSRTWDRREESLPPGPVSALADGQSQIEYNQSPTLTVDEAI